MALEAERGGSLLLLIEGDVRDGPQSGSPVARGQRYRRGLNTCAGFEDVRSMQPMSSAMMQGSAPASRLAAGRGRTTGSETAGRKSRPGSQSDGKCAALR
jgi:hypothetical protein